MDKVHIDKKKCLLWQFFLLLYILLQYLVTILRKTLTLKKVASSKLEKLCLGKWGEMPPWAVKHTEECLLLYLSGPISSPPMSQELPLFTPKQLFTHPLPLPAVPLALLGFSLISSLTSVSLSVDAGGAAAARRYETSFSSALGSCYFLWGAVGGCFLYLLLSRPRCHCFLPVTQWHPPPFSPSTAFCPWPPAPLKVICLCSKRWWIAMSLSNSCPRLWPSGGT